MSVEKIIPFEISHVQFSSSFKLIRHQHNLHFGEYLLMRNASTKRRVAVKVQPYHNKSELEIILTDMATLLQLNDCEYICPFVGFVLEETQNCQSIYFIYDYHQNSLTEEIKSMSLHQQKFSDEELLLFVNSMVKALAFLEQKNLNHMCLNTEHILIENRGNINMAFRLLITPFILEAYEQISQYRVNIEEYNLSEIQLHQLENKVHTKELGFSSKLRSDKQSLGLMSLRIGTLDNDKRIYEMDKKFQLIWNGETIEERVKELNKQYSKSTCMKIQYLLFEKDFHSFEKQVLPEFQQRQDHLSSKKHSSRKLNRSFPIGKSRISVTSKRSPQNSGVRENNESSQLKKIKWESASNSKFSLHEFSPDKSNREKYEIELKTIEEEIFRKLKLKSLDYKKKIYADGGQYIGSYRDDKREGFGLYYFKEGDIYGGEWNNDQIVGHGSYLFVTSQLYIGDVLRGMKHGKGQYKYANGNLYDGGWIYDKKEGYGIFYFYTKGENYQGNFKNGLKEGNGTYTWSNGDKFTGQFKNGIKNGHGLATKANGTTIKGQWKNDELTGIVNINFNTGVQFTGEIKDGQLCGLGSETGNGYFFEGQYQRTMKNGKGKLTFPNGDYFQGNFLNDQFDGFGEYFYSHQNLRYRGQWKGGFQEGKGSIEYRNGTVIETDWKGGQTRNYGKIAYQNGDKYEGFLNASGPNGEGVYELYRGERIAGEFRNGVLIKK